MDSIIPEGFSNPVHLHKRSKSRPRKPAPRHLTCDGVQIAITEWWSGGFATLASAPKLSRGHIEISQGGKLVAHGLAYATAESDGRRTYAFKRMQDARQAQPRDYIEIRPAPAGLISKNN